MKLEFGQSYTFKINERQKLDVRVYQHEWFTTIKMDTWEEGNGVALSCNEKKHFNYEKILPREWAEKLVVKVVNKQSQKVAGISIIK